MPAKLLNISDDTHAVLDAARVAGGRPLIVGGAVRDTLMGRTDSKDIDIEVHGLVDHDRLIRELGKVGRVDEYGAHYGVIAVRTQSEDFDVSYPRTETRAGFGHTGFDITVDSSLSERDAFSRRDFTINALGYDPATGALIDHFGGAADLAAGVLRHTSPSFADDPLRVLRAVQFSARFGMTLAPETAELCRSISDRYSELPVERVWREWQKIALCGTHISAALDVLVQTGWLHHFPELAATRGVQQDPIWHPEGDVYVHSGLAADAAAASCDRDGWDSIDRMTAVLGALVHDFGKVSHTQRRSDGTITSHGHAEGGVAPASAFLTRIGAPRYLIDIITPIVREHMVHSSTDGAPSAAAVRRLVRRLNPAGGLPSIHDWARVVGADCAGRGDGARPNAAGAWLEVANRIGEKAVNPIVTGADLIARGMTPGPAFKPILAYALASQDDGLFDEATADQWLDEQLPEHIRSVEIEGAAL